MQRALLTVTLMLMTPPASSLAQSPEKPMELSIVDVELGPQGQWSGKIVDAQGIGVGRLPARLSQGRSAVANVITNKAGRFALSNLSPGVHRLECDGLPRFYRFWKYGTAPPKAVQHSLIVTRGNVVRGVQGSRIYEWMSDHPVLTYTGIAAAIVTPIVVVGANQDTQPASP